MSDYVTIEVPREVLHATHMTTTDLRIELAISLFQQRKVSFGKARELASMHFWAFQQLLGSRSIPVHYDIEEYEADQKFLKTLDPR